MAKRGVTKGAELWPQPPIDAKPKAQGHARKSPMPGHKHNDGPVAKGPKMTTPDDRPKGMGKALPQTSKKAKTAPRPLDKYLEDGSKFAAKPKGIVKGDKKR
jgi:hypothetical protein